MCVNVCLHAWNGSFIRYLQLAGNPLIITALKAGVFSLRGRGVIRAGAIPATAVTRNWRHAAAGCVRLNKEIDKLIIYSRSY